MTPYRPSVPVAEDAPLGALTTLEVGGVARWLTAPLQPAEVARALAEADAAAVPTLVLGGGSNLVVADAGFPGLALRLAGGPLRLREAGTQVLVEAPAGRSWDALVAELVGQGLAGVECLAGIPGQVGAAPVQNIGAYGQEVAEVIEALEVYDRRGSRVRWLPAARCAFGYRRSRFKHADQGRFVVLTVRLRLQPGGAPTLRYRDLVERLAGTAPTLARVRETVLAVRRGKSMVLDPADPNRRSAGSFFVNPVVPAGAEEAVEARVRALGIEPASMPRWPGPRGVKLSAAWLIERAGLTRGHGVGRVGLSTRHTLALVNRGGATAAELVAFAAQVRRRVRAVFAVELTPEPVFVGFEGSSIEVLERA